MSIINKPVHIRAVGSWRIRTHNSVTVADPVFGSDFAEIHTESSMGHKYLTCWERRDGEYVRASIRLDDDTIVALVQELLK